MSIDIPTSLTERETEELARLTTDRIVFEAGALLGYSTVAIAQRARQVVSVDPHDGYPRHDPTPTWGLYTHNLRRFGVAPRVVPIRSGFQSVVIPPSVTFAWADLTGQYDITREFLERTHLVPTVAVHDYGRTGCSGATAAVDNYIREYKPRSVYTVDTLIVLAK